jgi:hypothetical protein
MLLVSLQHTVAYGMVSAVARSVYWVCNIQQHLQVYAVALAGLVASCMQPHMWLSSELA